ncbi:MAG: PAS domain-containing protein [Sphingobacteriales bacterium]|nr:MAG: PAS domain-containing protein [Sphingobacteriales bacterium]
MIPVPYVAIRSLDILSGYLQNLQLVGQDLESLKQLAQTSRWHQVPDFRKKLLVERKVILVTNLQQQIVFASHNLLEMNLYRPADVIGKTPRMFQGAATDPETRHRIRTRVAAYEPFQERVTNYKRNGHSYECVIAGHPVYNIHGEPAHFVAFEWLA